MGTILIVLLLEATRRAMGWPLPIIALLFMTYALAGPSFPGHAARTPARSWPSLVNHLYLTSQGIYGIALGVVATYVFHFVLFGVLATAHRPGPALHRHRVVDRRALRRRTGQGLDLRARRCSA